MLKIRRPLGRLIFNMGIAIPGKTVFLIETAPRQTSLWIYRHSSYVMLVAITGTTILVPHDDVIKMETFSALLAFCAGNSPVTAEFTAQRSVTRSFDVFFDQQLNRQLSKQGWRWWFERLSRSLWRPCNAIPCNQVTATHLNIMTSSNGSIFRVTGPLCGKFTGPSEFPTQRPVTRSFDVFFDLRLNKQLSKQPWGWWFETPSLSLWRQCNEMAGP